jgi:putative FmdB family regulatory protein
MPAEEYCCKACGHRFPWFAAEKGEPGCPRCGSTKLERNIWLLGGPGHQGLEVEDYCDALLAV